MKQPRMKLFSISFRLRLATLFLLLSELCFAQTFTEQTDISLTAVYNSAVAWGDYDNDGDLDILLTGFTTSNYTPVSKIIKNNGNNVFVEQTGITLIGVQYGAVAWGDYDNDGDLDILLAGSTAANTRVSKIYRNDGYDRFTEQTGISLKGTSNGSTTWADYDNDGDLDILITGYTDSGYGISTIYRNNGDNSFSEQTSISLIGLDYSSAAWGDYDNDGYLDLLIIGYTGSKKVSKIYRNNGNNSFSEQTDIALTGVRLGSVAWGDYDNDGDLDILLSGTSASSANTTTIYKNNGNNSFTEQTGISLTDVGFCSLAWGDYDNDGDLDILVTGNRRFESNGTSHEAYSKIYTNLGNDSFIENNAISLPNLDYSSVAWGDYDNDGDLDILMTGNNNYFAISKIVRNNSTVVNLRPNAPIGLGQSIIKNNVTLRWKPVTTDITPSKAMCYNVKVGTKSGAIDIVSPLSSTNGFRNIVGMGNGQLDTIFTLNNLAKGTYYWSVQAIDNSFMGGAFSEEGTFIVNDPIQAFDLTVSKIQSTDALIKWKRGDLNKCVVFIKEGADTLVPADNTTYSANPVYGQGTTIEDNWYCIYNGNADSLVVSGLRGGLNYTVQVFEYEGVSGSEQYLSKMTYANSKAFHTPVFYELKNQSLTGVYYSSTCWGDYDNDGDLDLLISGQYKQNSYSSSPFSRIYRNNGDDSFTEQTGLLSIETDGVAAWGDYDNDGFLDVALTGYGRLYLFHNNGNNSFTYLDKVSPTGFENTSITWADYDNDGDLDILGVSKLLRNGGDGNFTEQINTGIPSVRYGSVAWGDYDNDGYLDVLQTGYINSNCVSILYRNNGDYSFTAQKEYQFKGMEYGTSAWGDYDNDGDLDLVLSGKSGLSASDPNLTIIYRNNGDKSFTEQKGIALAGIEDGTVAWGDYDNDGDLDLLVSGSGLTKVYRNNGNNSFTDQTDVVLAGIDIGAVAWGDYDNDGDLDIVLTGLNGSNNISKIYRNDGVKENICPNAPNGLLQSISGTTALLSWKPVEHDESATKGMSYDVKVVHQSDSLSITPVHSSNNGIRKIVAMGNAQLDTTFTLRNLKKGVYDWSVQAVDNGFKGGAYSPRGSFTITDVIQAHSLAVSSYNGTSAVLNWARGSLANCVVFIKEGVGNLTLSDHTKYIASTIFGQGTTAGDGWYCMYNGVGEKVSVTGLKGGTNYSIKVVEYDELLGAETYLSTNVPDNVLTFKTRPFNSKSGFSGAYWDTSDSGDFDNDGDLDVIIAGSVGETGWTSYYRNTGNFNFTNVSSLKFAWVKNGTVEWGDYNNDGKLDVLLIGRNRDPKSYSAGSDVTALYRNNGYDSFTGLQTPFNSFHGNLANMVDYDGDGDLDVFIASSNSSKIFRNNGNDTFEEQTSILFPGADGTATAWGDYNNDGFVDLLLTGTNNTSTYSKIYLNNGNNSFSEQTNISLTGVSGGSVAWGDFDNDGYLDILLTGSGVSKIYRNNGDNSFTEQSNVALTGVSLSSAAWGDFDNDGDLDILLTGYDGTKSISKIYVNNGDRSFSEQTDCMMDGITNGTALWGDLDNDGDLDVSISDSKVSKIYSNELTNSKTISKNAPTKLNHQVLGTNAFLSWNPVSIKDIPQKALSYNVSVLKSVDSTSMNPVHSAKNGFRYVAHEGNAKADTSFQMMNLSPGTYIWKVQMVDNAWNGSAFSRLDTFTIVTPIQARSLKASLIDGSSVDLNWKRGNGDSCVVFMKEGTGSALLSNKSNYLASIKFGQGSTLEDGWYCIYNGFGEHVTVTNLNGLTDYTVQVFEYTGSKGAEKYMTTITSDNNAVFKTGNFSKIEKIPSTIYTTSSILWGDYDHDGFLDFLMTGNTDNHSPTSKIYRNNGDCSFSEQSNIQLTGVAASAVEWGDYDNDGDLDILLTGYTSGGNVSKIYRNEGANGFAEQTGVSLTGIMYGDVAWGDLDNDGDLDIVLTGESAGGVVTEIYRNNGDNSFSKQSNSSMPGVNRGSVSLGDYDNDGDLDILLTGNTQKNIITKIYANNGNFNFTEQTGINLPGIYDGSAEWADLNNDGYLDIVLAGSSNYRVFITKIYKNNGNNSFTELSGLNLSALEFARVSCGDYDNDADLDILLTGYYSGGGSVSIIIDNNGNDSFTERKDITIRGGLDGCAAWGDYDNDGDLDILHTGSIYRNFITRSLSQLSNKKPLSPKNLTARKIGNEVVFSWEGDSSDETPLESLTYNIAFGKTQNAMYLGPPHSNTGSRTVVSMGNTGLNNFYKVKVDSAGYYWAVQAVDGGFQGGEWSVVDSFNIRSVESQKAEYVVYPNPVFNFLTIKCLDTMESQIGIYSLNGELMKMGTMKENSFNLDLSKLSQGMYLVKIVNANGSTFKKIIKSNP